MDPYTTGQETDDRTRIARMTRMHTDIVSVKIRLIRVIRVPVFAALLCALGVLCGVKRPYNYNINILNPRR